ncbi:MAG: hypothetical protein IPG92_01240 [Flavobacteriales bacterium]|nr:hypothetical protein [Flavobacteriales bacterium]
MRIKNLFLGILLATGASNPVLSQDAAKEMYVSIPCRVDADDVSFVYDADRQVLPSGIVVVRVVTMKKTESRRSFADLTPIELKRLRKQARKARSCEIVVINDYKLPAQVNNPDKEMEARMQQEIQFIMVQRIRPCPECSAANN